MMTTAATAMDDQRRSEIGRQEAPHFGQDEAAVVALQQIAFQQDELQHTYVAAKRFSHSVIYHFSFFNISAIFSTMVCVCNPD